MVLVFLGIVEDRVGFHSRLMTFRLTAPDSTGMIQRVHEITGEVGIEPRRWQSRRTNDGFVVEFDANVTTPQERTLLSKFGALNVHSEAHPLN